jgi:hypothetical protein
MERVADALEGIQSVAVRKDDPWKAVAQRLAALYEARAVELTLNEDEVSALMAVAKLSKGD